MTQCSFTNNPLSVVWSYFNASPQNNEVNIDWGISQALSIKGFYVERSSDSKNWQQLAFVPYSFGNLDYILTDASPLSGNNYYKIVETDNDGNSNYSDIRLVNMPSSSNISIWPNPATDAIHIRCGSNANNMTASIFDELGRNVLNSVLYQGDNMINLGNISPGIYFIVVKENNAQVAIKKIMVRAN